MHTRPPHLSKADLRQLQPTALARCHSPAAAHLPGWSDEVSPLVS